MAYRLIINNKELDIFQKKNYSLEAIDDFTSNFENEDDLKEYLLENEFITYGDFYEPIYILNKNDNNIKTTIIYKKWAKYLDEKVLSKYFSDRTNDHKLLSKLIYTFKGYKQLKYDTLCRNIYHYIYDIEKYDFIDAEESLENIVRRLINRACENYLTKRKIALIIIDEEIKQEKKINEEKIKYYQERLKHIKSLLSYNIDNNGYESLIDEAKNIEKILNIINSTEKEEIEEQIIIEELGENYGENSRH